MAKSTKHSRARKGQRMAEWIVGACGAIMVIGTIGYLVYAEAFGGATAPFVELMQQKTTPQSDGYLVEFRVRNSSSFSAAKLRIKGELRSGGEIIESAETEIDYLPAFSSRDAGLYFQHDPVKSRLQISPVSYTNP
jgi:uncharacterized protein (TIGR02588 family)